MNEKVFEKNALEEYSKAWHDFVFGNIELFAGHSELIELAFKAGYLAGKYEERKEPVNQVSKK